VNFYFNGGVRNPQLVKSEFFHPLLDDGRIAVRGKSPGGYPTEYSFQWSPGVQALSILILKNASSAVLRTTNMTNALVGRTGSPAVALDNALYKQPAWLIDMFGSDSRGSPLISRILKRSNPGMKRPEPTIVAIRSEVLVPSGISIFMDDHRINDENLLSQMAEIIQSTHFHSFHLSTLSKPSLRDSVEIVELSESTQIPSADRHSQGQIRFESQGPDNKFESVALKSCYSWPFDNAHFRKTLEHIYIREVNNMLADSDVFNRVRYIGRVAEIIKSDFFKKFGSKPHTLANGIDLDLSTTARLGVNYDQKRMNMVLRDGDPIKIVTPPTLSSTVCILYYLKYFKRYNIEIDFRMAIAKEFLLRLKDATLEDFPDACIVPLGTACMILSNKSLSDYVPLMLMPGTTHRVVSSKRKSVKQKSLLNYGCYAFFKSTPSSSDFYFEELIKRGCVSKDKVEVMDLAPHEITALLYQGADDLKAIQWFPIYHFNRMFCGSFFVDDEVRDSFDTATFLFIHESMIADKHKATCLDIAIRDAWLDLRAEVGLLSKVVRRVFEDLEYLRFLGRCGGLFAIPQKGFEVSRNEVVTFID